MKVYECKTMDESTKEKPQMTFQAGCTLSELLEDSGNHRQINNQELSLRLLTDSLFSEQQKLRHVLNWAHSFLSTGSEVHHEFCRADRLMLVNKEQRETQKKTSTWKHSSAAEYHHPVSCSAGCNEVFWGEVGASMEKVWHLEPSDYENTESKGQLYGNKPFSDEPCIPFSFTPGIDEVTLPKSRETPEKMKSMKLQDATDKQTPRRRSSPFKPNQRQCSNFSDGNASQTPAADDKTSLIKKNTSCWNNACHKKSRVFGTAGDLKVSYKRAGVQSERERSQKKTELSKVKVEGKVQTKKEVVWMDKRKGKVNKEEDSSSAYVLYAKNNISKNEPEMTQELMEKTSTLSSCSHLKLSPTLTVYEQYQLCVDHLHHLRIKQSQHINLGCFIESPAKERKTSKEMAAPVEAPAPPTSGFQLNSSTKNPEIKKRLNKRVTAAEITMERSSAVTNKNQAKSKYNRNRATLAEQEQTKHCDNLTVRETPAAVCAESRRVCQSNTFTSNKHLDLDSKKYGELIKETAGGITSTNNGTAVEKSVSHTPNTGLRIGWNPGVKGCRSRVEGQKKKAGGRGASLRLCEKSRVSLSSLNKKEILQRPQSSEVIKHKEKHTSEDKVKPASAFRLTHKYLQPTDTRTPLHEDPQSVSPTTGACRCKQTDCKYSPAGVPVCDRWLCLPDEVWLSILCLLPHSDLSRVLQVCSRLHTLATDHSLWKDLRIENSNLTEPWLLCVGRWRPRSLSLYSCSGLSLTSCGLEMFFTLCRKTLEELKVTSCTGPGLHGDQMLPLIGQLCDHVTSVDVSWSGATDTGVKALSDCCTGLQLKSVVLNGCHVTDDPLMKLVLRHKQSLCRLEVFGCQFLTPSCLQKVYEVCPGLYHLNIGQVPKVDAHSLTVMTSQLKCLISLNLTGLQAVSDAKVDTLLQNCVRLQSLTFSSCPGVTDLTLHSISKHTPCIRSLDVSYCEAVTDAGVQALAQGCRKLQQLDLSSTGTGNRGVTLLANYCSKHLHTLKLSFCHITIENILKLCRCCKRLKVLHLYGCAQLPTEREIRDVNTTVKVHPHS